MPLDHLDGPFLARAIGFLAAVTAHLAESGIAVNAVSAFHHDHLFVPAARAEEAMRRLGEFSERGAVAAF